MSHASSRLEITDRLIDFGSHVVQLSQITSVRVRRRLISLTIVGALSLLAGIALLGLVAYSGFQFVMNPGNAAVLHLLAVVPGLILLLIGRHLLFELSTCVIVSASDGAKIAIPARREEMLVAVFQHIKQALASADTPFSVRIDLAKNSVEGGVAATRHGGADDGGIVLPSGGENSRDARYVPEHAGRQAGANGNGYTNGTGATTGQAVVVGAKRTTARTGGMQQAAGGRQAHGATTTPRGGEYAARGGDRSGVPQSMPSGVPHSRPETRAVEYISEILMLMDDAKVPYQDDLERMLFLVRSHLVGEGVSREDAMNNWAAFSEYARDYLSAVEGLVPLIDQVQASPAMRQS